MAQYELNQAALALLCAQITALFGGLAAFGHADVLSGLILPVCLVMVSTGLLTARRIPEKQGDRRRFKPYC
jgi:hypothetical protein